MSVYAIVNRKGGVGKTTTAVHLAHGLALKMKATPGGDQRVLLIDIDPQGNCAAALGIPNQDKCVSDLLTGKATLRDVIIHDGPVEEGGTGRPGLYLIPSSDRLVDATEELLIRGFQSFRRGNSGGRIEEIFEEHIGPFRQHFQFIIIDCPPSLGSLTEAIYHFADRAIVPVKPALLDAGGTAQHTQQIIDLQTNGLDITVDTILPTFFDGRQILSREIVRDLAVKYGRKVIGHPIPNSVIVQQAQASGGKTLFEYEPAAGHSQTKAYSKLVDRVYHE